MTNLLHNHTIYSIFSSSLSVEYPHGTVEKSDSTFRLLKWFPIFLTDSLIVTWLRALAAISVCEAESGSGGTVLQL